MQYRLFVIYDQRFCRNLNLVYTLPSDRAITSYSLKIKKHIYQHMHTERAGVPTYTPITLQRQPRLTSISLPIIHNALLHAPITYLDHINSSLHFNTIDTAAYSLLFRNRFQYGTLTVTVCHIHFQHYGGRDQYSSRSLKDHNISTRHRETANKFLSFCI